MNAQGDPAFVNRYNEDPPEEEDDRWQPPPPSRWPLALAFIGALLGTLFSALSTSDFMQHLDRQVHAIHCSFVPGAAKDLGESGCRTVMMSPYSSFFREALWGGIPISLWALAVFAFLAYRSGFLLWKGNPQKSETRFLLAASGLPVAMSVIFAYLSISKLDATCKVCVAMYLASALCFLGALIAQVKGAQAPEGKSRFLVGVLEGCAFVGALSVVYLLAVPKTDPEKTVAGCGFLVQEKDTAGIMIPLSSSRAGGVASIELLDPLCPSCKSFDARLSASSLRERLDLKAVLFPLDSTCNWMVTEALHPGACAVSEAMLCAAGLDSAEKNAAAANDVLKWAFANQEALRTLAAKSDSAVRSEIEKQFPSVKGCLGGYLVKNKLTKSLRWAVANAVPVLTPQLFVGPTRMCDEDTDLGLEYTLSRMLAPDALRAAEERRPPPPPPPPVIPGSATPVADAAAGQGETVPAAADSPAAVKPAGGAAGAPKPQAEPEPAEEGEPTPENEEAQP